MVSGRPPPPTFIPSFLSRVRGFARFRVVSVSVPITISSLLITILHNQSQG